MKFVCYDFDFIPIEDQKWLLINHDKGYAFKLNEYTKLLISSINDTSNWSDAYAKYLLAAKSQGIYEDPIESYQNKVEEILNRFEIQARRPRKQLTASIRLLKPKVFGGIAKYLICFINTPMLIVNFILFPVLAYFLYVHFHISPDSNMYISRTGMMVAFILILFSFILHEFGHGAALIKSGLNTGQLGIGLFLIYPVFFTEMFANDTIPGRNRFHINIAGSYFQIFLGNIIAIIALFYAASLMALAAIVIYLGAIVQIIPVNRSDGYWAIYDILSSLHMQKSLRVMVLFSNAIIIPILIYIIIHAIRFQVIPLFFELHDVAASKGGALNAITFSEIISFLELLIIPILALRLFLNVYRHKKRAATL